MQHDIDLTGYRHAFWGGADGAEQIVFLGEDLSAASVTWSFAEAFGGTPCLVLTNAQPEAQGIHLAYDDGYLHPQSGRPVGASILTPRIDMSTMQTLPTQEAQSSGSLETNTVLRHTLYVARNGQNAAVFSGSFTIRQGVPH